MQAKQKKEFICWFPPAGRYSAISNPNSNWNKVSWEGRQTPSLKEFPLSSSFTSAFIAEHDVVWYGISLWSVWVSCPLLASCASLVAGMVAWEAEKSSTLCKHCSATSKTSAYYQYHFIKKKKKVQNTTSYKPLRRNLTLSPSKSRHLCKVRKSIQTICFPYYPICTVGFHILS